MVASAAAQPRGAGLLRRTSVTLAGVAWLLALERIPLPFLDEELLLLVTGGQPSSAVTLGALGLVPFVSAFVLVELVALAVPRLRSRRHGPAEARAPLTRSAFALALVLAAAQGWGTPRTCRPWRAPPASRS